MVLVTGFGPFRDVIDNPSARIARAVHGRTIQGIRVVGAVLPVVYGAGPDAAVAAARAHRAFAVLGFGRHPDTPVPRVETLGYNAGSSTDVAGRVWRVLEPNGPPTVRTNVDAPALAQALGGAVTEDAGRYVCNAWVYRVSRALGGTLTVGFVHVPPEGIDPERVVRAIGKLWG